MAELTIQRGWCWNNTTSKLLLLTVTPFPLVLLTLTCAKNNKGGGGNTDGCVFTFPNVIQTRALTIETLHDCLRCSNRDSIIFQHSYARRSETRSFHIYHNMGSCFFVEQSHSKGGRQSDHCCEQIYPARSTENRRGSLLRHATDQMVATACKKTARTSAHSRHRTTGPIDTKQKDNGDDNDVDADFQ